MPSLIVATYPPLDRLAEPPSGTQGLMQARAVLALALHARGNPGAHTVLAETLASARPAGFILRIIAHGRHTREIAQDLFLVIDTVRKHTSHILSKLDASGRNHAVERARQLGLFP
jgi:DNA-binding CsgD family transcriptional regulator